METVPPFELSDSQTPDVWRGSDPAGHVILERSAINCFMSAHWPSEHVKRPALRRHCHPPQLEPLLVAAPTEIRVEVPVMNVNLPSLNSRSQVESQTTSLWVRFYKYITFLAA